MLLCLVFNQFLTEINVQIIHFDVSTVHLYYKAKLHYNELLGCILKKSLLRGLHY